VAIEESRKSGFLSKATRVFASCLLPFSLDNRLAVVILQCTATTTRSISEVREPSVPRNRPGPHPRHTPSTPRPERYSRSSSDRRPLVGFGRESQSSESFFFISRGARGSNLELPFPARTPLPTYSRLFNSFVSISTLSSFLIIIPNKVERGRLAATVHLGRKQTGRLNHVSS
jgi:hypothetical protein